jgi:hypothetical protein
MVKRPWLAWIPVGLGLVLASALVAVYETLRTGAGQVSAAAVDFFVFAVNAFNLVGTAATVFVVVRLLLVRLRGTEPAERKQAGIMLVGFLPAFVMGWAISLLQLAEGDRPGSLTQSLLLFYSPILELAAAAIVAYAILRYRFLGVDQTARLSLRSVVIALALVLIFVATQVFTNVVLQGGVFAFAGPYGSFLITGAVSLVALRPVDKLGQRLSSRLVPQEAKEDRAASIYRAQVTHVLRDGNVTDREWAFLRSLRDQLGIAGQAARRIEEEVERALKVDDPRTGQPGPTA